MQSTLDKNKSLVINLSYLLYILSSLLTQFWQLINFIKRHASLCVTGSFVQIARCPPGAADVL